MKFKTVPRKINTDSAICSPSLGTALVKGYVEF